MAGPYKPLTRTVIQASGTTWSIAGSLTFNDTTTNVVYSPTHDNFNANANLQLSDADINTANAIPITVENSVTSYVQNTLSVIGTVAEAGATGDRIIVAGRYFASDTARAPHYNVASGINLTIVQPFDGGFNAPDWDANGIAYDYIAGTSATKATAAFLKMESEFNNLEVITHATRDDTVAVSLISGQTVTGDTTVASTAMSLAQFMGCNAFIDVDTTGTVTDVVFDLEGTSDGGTTWYPLRIDHYVDLRYANAQMPVQELIPPPGGIALPRQVRFSVTFDGASATAFFVWSLSIDRFNC